GGMSGLRRVPRIVPDLVPLDGGTGDGWLDDCVVAGPLCTPLDTWSQGVRLPRLRPGDLVAVPNVGAYGLTASLLALPGPAPRGRSGQRSCPSARKSSIRSPRNPGRSYMQ